MNLRPHYDMVRAKTTPQLVVFLGMAGTVITVLFAMRTFWIGQLALFILLFIVAVFGVLLVLANIVRLLWHFSGVLTQSTDDRGDGQ